MTTEEEITIQTILPPLLLSLSIWTTCYYISVLSPTGTPTGFESIWISNLHTLALVAMASLSLMEVIPEYIPSCWSTSFFLVDTIDCIWKRDAMWGFHGIISLVLNVCTASHGVHRRLRSASKGFFTEASTPFLNYWKTHKSYKTYLLFFISFTACRIIWVPYFIYNTYQIHLHGEIDYLIGPSVLFYFLQLAWWVKMVEMLVRYKTPEELEKERKKKD